MRHYDRLAPIYESEYAEEQNRKMETALRALEPRGEALLDIGCGTGLLFNHVKGKVGLIVGLDISRGMLREARKRATSPNILLVQADSDHMPFPNQTFNLAFAITLIQNTPNPLSTLIEMERVCKPNSHLVITGLKKSFTGESFKKLLEKAELEIQTIKEDVEGKEFIAICKTKNPFIPPHIRNYLDGGERKSQPTEA